MGIAVVMAASRPARPISVAESAATMARPALVRRMGLAGSKLPTRSLGQRAAVRLRLLPFQEFAMLILLLFYCHWPLSQRLSLKWPNDARLVLWVIPNVELFRLDELVGREGP